MSSSSNSSSSSLNYVECMPVKGAAATQSSDEGAFDDLPPLESIFSKEETEGEDYADPAFPDLTTIIEDERKAFSRNSKLSAGLADPYGDGDQSPLKGMAAQDLRAEWCRGMTFSILLSCDASMRVLEALCPSFIVSCARGDAAAVEKRLSIVRDDAKALTELLEVRGTPYRLSALLACVAGARSCGRGHLVAKDEAKADHVRVAKALLDAGARTNAKDVLGMNAWLSCLTNVFTDQSLAIASEMLRRGLVDVNSQNKEGRNALIELCMDMTGGKCLPAIVLALEAGTDPTLFDNDGYNAMRLAKITPFFPALGATIKESQLRGRANAGRTLEGSRVILKQLAREDLNGRIGRCGVLDCRKGRYSVTLLETTAAEAAVSAPISVPVKNVFFHSAPGSASEGTVSKPCASCKKVAESNKACSRCKLAFYCNSECQKAHWPKHKPVCK